MGEKNRQHYVPKFYLRNFSDREKSIDTYNIGNSRYIQNASIRDMCQKNNFYGADKKVENFLDRDIETRAAAIIKNILETNEFPRNYEDYIHLVMFILISEARNLRYADSTNHMVDYVAKTLIKEHPDFKDLDLDKFKIEMTTPANQSIETAIRSIPTVLDLEPLLIIEQTGARRFLTSDNPVVRYNWLYVKKGYWGGYGFVNRGIQFFFPVSPNKCILLYDKYAYDIPEAKNNVLILKKAREVDKLNEFFYLNAYNNVFFNQKTKREYIESLHFKNKKTPRINELEREVSSFVSDDSYGELIHFSHNKVAKNINFSWISLTNLSKNLKMPAHMGGINRTESPYIREFLEKQKNKYEKERPLFNEKYYRKSD